MGLINFIHNISLLFNKHLVLNGKNKFRFLWTNKLNIDNHSFITIDCSLFRNNEINMNDRFNRGKLCANVVSSSSIMNSKLDLMGTQNILNISMGGQ